MEKPVSDPYLLYLAKKNIDEGYIAPGLGGETKTNKKNTIDEGYIAPGLRGAKKKH
jgi:hypothetical protein